MAGKQNDAGSDGQKESHILRGGSSSFAKSIIGAVVMKSEDLFFLADPTGNVPLSPGHGLGLYYHDCRYLDGYELRIGGFEPEALFHRAEDGFESIFELCNPELTLADGTKVKKQTVAIHWKRVLDFDSLCLRESLCLRNFGEQKARVPVSLNYSAHFEDVLEIRRVSGASLGRLRRPKWNGRGLRFAYQGKDRVERTAVISFSRSPKKRRSHGAEFELEIAPSSEKSLEITIQIAERPARQTSLPRRSRERKLATVSERRLHELSDWRAALPKISTSNPLFDQILTRAFGDLHMLKSRFDGYEFFSAGLPWYGALFGRDSIFAALLNLPFLPEMAAHTLRLLAKHQGTKVDDWRDEEPGKILHELRRGEYAHLNLVPQTPYYGTVDATPLYLLLLGEYGRWTGDLELFHELRETVERALKWIDDYGDISGRGYLEYESRSEKGLSNQGWKDSGNSIFNEDGSLCEPPIALVEVQGYVYAAKLAIADLFERAGEASRAAWLREEAQALRAQFNRDFWVKEKRFYALCLQKKGRAATIVTSNPGQALWTKIVDPRRARHVVARLLRDDMFTGWGVRTLSKLEPRYNPIGYHLGSVWPQDNALIAAGFRHYGFDEEALRIFEGHISAASFFDHFRLPELFSGFRREAFGAPVQYPVACHPQAWAASAPGYLLLTLLGLEASAFDRTLRIVRPVLPANLTSVEIEGLRVGDAVVDLRFERMKNGIAGTNIRRVKGRLEILTESEPVRHSPRAA